MNYISEKDKEYGGNIIILVGPPGCGKSSFAKKYLEENPGWEILSSDSVREELTGNRHDQLHNKKVFATIYGRLHDMICEGKNVIYDATNCNKLHREKILNVVKYDANKIICLVTNKTLLTCIRHNDYRTYTVPEQVIERMYINMKLNPPSLFDGYDIISYFDI